MSKILQKEFFQKPALEIATEFLGKTLVHITPDGRISGIIKDVEAYPAKIDEVSHGNKRTKPILVKNLLTSTRFSIYNR